MRVYVRKPIKKKNHLHAFARRRFTMSHGAVASNFHKRENVAIRYKKPILPITSSNAPAKNSSNVRGRYFSHLLVYIMILGTFGVSVATEHVHFETLDGFLLRLFIFILPPAVVYPIWLGLTVLIINFCEKRNLSKLFQLSIPVFFSFILIVIAYLYYD